MTMPRLVEKPWFGPRRVPGWGWTPVTWQGWAVIAVFIVAISRALPAPGSVAAKVIAEWSLIVAAGGRLRADGTRPGAGCGAADRR